MVSTALLVLILASSARALSVVRDVPHPTSPPCSREDLERAKATEFEARAYLQEQLDVQYSQQCHLSAEAEWKYATNITKENEKLKLDASLTFTDFVKNVTKNLIDRYPWWRCFQQQDLLRQFKKLTVLGKAVLPEDQLKEYDSIINEMETIYSTAKICSFQDRNKCDLSLEPDASEIMKTSRDYEELQHVWTEWHNKGAHNMRPLYKRFVELSNKVANLNRFADTSSFWLDEYETETFKGDIEELWQTMKPFYTQVHAYVRSKLRKLYGAANFGEDGLIPAHLLGNMWSQTWDHIITRDALAPFPNKPSIDVTEQMKQQGYTPLKMFQKSEEFFTSLGLEPMTEEFWNNSVIEKPGGREVICHASAWDFCTKTDFRIKQCTTVDMEYFGIVHHEMGHIAYDQQYKNQPYIYRGGANPGFHEAVGDTLTLSVITPKHLRKIGLLDSTTPIDDFETSINYLFKVALAKIVFLPFGYIMDKWRWDIFDGTTSPDDYNCAWWKLREEYQGIKSPVPRCEQHFDAGSKYHIPANVEYIRYFVSAVIQFQFHRALCLEAGQYDPVDPTLPLHSCDIYESKNAGRKLSAMLSMGGSRPWPEAMRAITGQDRMDATAIREYFKPLEDWLVEQNKKSGEEPGWTPGFRSCQACDTTS